MSLLSDPDIEFEFNINIYHSEKFVKRHFAHKGESAK